MAISEQTRQQLDTALRAAVDKNAHRPVALDVSQWVPFGDVFLIVSGTSERNVAAIADSVEQAFAERGIKARNREGKQAGQWVLLEFGDVIVHVFTDDQRDFYNLERVWNKAPVVELPLLDDADAVAGVPGAVDAERDA